MQIRSQNFYVLLKCIDAQTMKNTSNILESFYKREEHLNYFPKNVEYYVKNIEKQNEMCINRINQLEASQKSINDQLKNYQQQISNLNDQLTNSKQQISDLNDQLTNSKQKISEFNTNNQNLSKLRENECN